MFTYYEVLGDSVVCLLADNTEERVAQRNYGYAYETKKQQKRAMKAYLNTH